MPILRVIAGPDGRDAGIVPMPLSEPTSVDPRSLRVAFYTSNDRVPPIPDVQQLVRDAAALLARHGARVTEARPPELREGAALRSQLLAADGSAHVRRVVEAASFDPGLGVPPHQRSDGHRRPTHGARGATGPVAKRDALVHSRLRRRALPGRPFPARRLDGERDRTIGAYTSVYNVTGWPAGVVRMGTSPEGLPLGLQIVGSPWGDRRDGPPRRIRARRLAATAPLSRSAQSR